MDSLPIHLRLKDQDCLVVGGGEIAWRKTDLLIRAGACVHIVAPQVRQDLSEKVLKNGGEVQERVYESRDVQGKRLVIAATDDVALNRAVYQDAESAGVLVNVVDAPDLCRFVFPAIVDRSPLLISASTGGGNPVLSRKVRSTLEIAFPASYGDYAKLLTEYRTKTKDQFHSIDERRLFWEQVLEGPVSDQALSGNLVGARALLEDTIEKCFSKNRSPDAVGEVFLVGAGPGDPDLMTFRALRLLQRADVVIYDRLVGEGVVELARRDAEKIFAGKANKNHVISQENINALLVKHALAGKRVCRLKGGDPFIFGRGGEEIQTLAEHQIPFQVVPGVTAAAGCAAYAGIPLTHRDYAQSVRFVTGHLKNGELDLPWDKLVNPQETLVFYMGLGSLPLICSQLIAHGMDSHCPIALVEQGTLPTQRVFTGQLVSFADQLAKETLSSPALLIIGHVVQLHNALRWFQV